MNYSTIKEIYSFANDLSIDPREVTEEISNDNTDFEVDGYRFIETDVINDIQTEELESDSYILGAFNAWFLASILDIDTELIELLQEADKYEKIGEMIINKGLTSELQEEYSRMDGYGHHFSHYDGNEYELIIDGYHYHVFRVN